MESEKITECAKTTLRIGMALVFLSFGVMQLSSPEQWLGFLPEWTTNLQMSQTIFVYLNGSAEIILGLFLIVGLYTRAAALLLGLHLLGISLSVGYSPTMIRDLGLTIATITAITAIT